MTRKLTRRVAVGGIPIGGGEPVVVQSMLNTRAGDIKASVAQAKALEQAGCQIVRIAVPDQDGVRLIGVLKEAVSMPVVADIHFDYRLALESIAAGVDKIRINPGNIGSDDRVRQVAEGCKRAGIPIRIGVNSGSVEKEILRRFGGPTPEAMVENAAYHVSLLEQFDFHDIILSLKSSGVPQTIEAYRLASQRFDYPLHLGVTEAGTERMGLVKSAVGIGSLLADGIGDTIRVSLTADPVKEIAAAKDILRAVGLDQTGPTIVSCPTCGRTRIDLIGLAHQVEEALADCKKPIKVAVMGCIVNGPGESRQADIGVSLPGSGESPVAPVYIRGEKAGVLKGADIAKQFQDIIEKFVRENYAKQGS